MTTRGVRNCNPGNIDRNATRWQGMADDQSSDPRFIVFKAPEWGIRAMARTLMTYQDRHACNTVRKIIDRWAPPVENNTEAYIKAVAKAVGVKPGEPIDVDRIDVMLPLVKAIIAHENAGYSYPESVVLDGLHKAGVADAKPKPLVAQKAFVAQCAAGVSLIGASAAEYAVPIKTTADKLSDFTGSPIIQHVVTILLTVAGLCVLAGIASTVLKQRRS